MSTSLITSSTVELSDEQLVETINDHHAAATSAAQTALSRALAAGDALAEAKRRCRHGEWGGWLAKHFAGSDRTARAYMRLASNRELIESKSAESAVLTIDSALQSIADKRSEGEFTLPNDFSNPYLPDWRDGQAFIGYNFDRFWTGGARVQIVPSPGSSDWRCCYVTVIHEPGLDGSAAVDYSAKPAIADHKILLSCVLTPRIKRELEAWVWQEIDQPSIWYSDQMEDLSDSPIQVGTHLDNWILRCESDRAKEGQR